MSTIATRVTAGVQPTGRAMPQLLPDGLGPESHLEVAKGLTHPFARPPSVPAYVSDAIDAQLNLPGDLNLARARVSEGLQTLACACMDENQHTLRAVHPHIRPIVAKRNIAFMREVNYLCNGVDYNLVIDYVFGLPMMGWARHSPVMLQRKSDPPRAVRPSLSQIAAENAIALSRAKPSYSAVLDKLAWEKTQKEFEHFSMLGPYYSLAELPSGDPAVE